MNDEKFEILTQILKINNSEEYDSEIIDSLKQRVLALNDNDLKSSMAELFYDWSIVALQESDTEELFNKALTIIEEATKLNPSKDKYYFNWAVIIAEYRETIEGLDKEYLLHEEIEKYNIATKLNPLYHEPFHNWGNCVLELALSMPSNQAVEKLKETASLFTKSFCIDTSGTRPMQNLASTYHYLAGYDQVNRDEWLENARYCYSILATNFHDKGGIDGLGIVSKDIALTKKGEEKEKLFTSAIHHHLAAIQKGASIYNLACTYAAMGDAKSAFFFLEKSLQSERIIREEITEDSDWATFIENEQFNKILDKANC